MVKLVPVSNDNRADMLRDAASSDSLKDRLKYTLTRVEAHDEVTKNTSCVSVLEIKVPKSVQYNLQSGSLDLNEVGDDYLSFKISYSVQPTADSDELVYSLSNADDIASIAIAGALADARGRQEDLEEQAVATDESYLDDMPIDGVDYSSDEENISSTSEDDAQMNVAVAMDSAGTGEGGNMTNGM